MINELTQIVHLVAQAFIRIWPYLLLTIPIAVAVNLSGAARYIRKALSARPVSAIMLATLVGAFSPFCSCGVIPVIASLLLGGVPLAPVMAFWIASPSMDPEIFFLSVATIGWELALWRLASTLVLSLSAGFVTHAAVRYGWISGSALRTHSATVRRPVLSRIGGVIQTMRSTVAPLTPALAGTSCSPDAASPTTPAAVSAAIRGSSTQTKSSLSSEQALADRSGCSETSCSPSEQSIEKTRTFSEKLLREGGVATLMVAKFMLIALVLEAILKLYLPQEWVVAAIGQSNRLAVLSAALVGVPLYTSNLTALPMVGALLAQGMSPSAALSFLIAGPITTIPAMAAVWGLMQHRVFVLYVAFALIGAVLFGFAHQFAQVMGS